MKVTVFQKLMFINLQARNDSKLLVINIIHCSFTFNVATISSVNSWKAPEIIAEVFTYFLCEEVECNLEELVNM